MKKISELYTNRQKTFSFELFPPKTEEGYQKLIETIGKLSDLKPNFISCTYGAGGSSREKTFAIVELIQNKYQVISLAHLTCVINTKDQIKDILNNVKNRGINNILALRGDPPLDNPNWAPGKDNFKYSFELCAFIKKNFGDYFAVGVAGFPEGHINCPNQDLDAKYLKTKIDNGADYVITQLFFDNNFYYKYVERLKKLGVKVPIIPGIVPITNYPGLVKFANNCGATITDEVKRIFEPIQNDLGQTAIAGEKFAIKQCRDLLKNGAPGIHFYCLNKVSPTDNILKTIRS